MCTILGEKTSCEPMTLLKDNCVWMNSILTTPVMSDALSAQDVKLLALLPENLELPKWVEQQPPTTGRETQRAQRLRENRNTQQVADYKLIYQIHRELAQLRALNTILTEDLLFSPEASHEYPYIGTLHAQYFEVPKQKVLVQFLGPTLKRLQERTNYIHDRPGTAAEPGWLAKLLNECTDAYQSTYKMVLNLMLIQVGLTLLAPFIILHMGVAGFLTLRQWHKNQEDYEASDFRQVMKNPWSRLSIRSACQGQSPPFTINPEVAFLYFEPKDVFAVFCGALKEAHAYLDVAREQCRAQHRRKDGWQQTASASEPREYLVLPPQVLVQTLNRIAKDRGQSAVQLVKPSL